MARAISLGFAFLAIGSASAFAQDTGCQVPGPEYTHNSLDAVPKEVATLALEKWPGLKPTMAGCPATGRPDMKSPCLYNAVQYGINWVVAVSTAGPLPTTAFGVFYYQKAYPARELHFQEIAIPQCSLNRVAGITPASPKPKTLPKRPSPTPG